MSGCEEHGWSCRKDGDTEDKKSRKIKNDYKQCYDDYKFIPVNGPTGPTGPQGCRWCFR